MESLFAIAEGASEMTEKLRQQKLKEKEKNEQLLEDFLKSD